MKTIEIHFSFRLHSFLVDDKRKMTSAEIVEALFNMKSDLLSHVDLLGRNLPANTLDELIDQLGGPSQVAEVC